MLIFVKENGSLLNKEYSEKGDSICVIQFEKQDIDHLENLVNACKSTSDEIDYPVSLVLHNKEKHTQEEVQEMIMAVTPAKAVVEKEVYSTPNESYENVEYRFHQLKRNRDIEGLQQLAKDYPVPFGLAVEEFFRNVIGKQK